MWKLVLISVAYLFQFAASILLAGLVHTLLHLLLLRQLGTVRLLLLLVLVLIRLDILYDTSKPNRVFRCRPSTHTSRLCLIFSFCSRMRAMRSASSSSLGFSYRRLHSEDR